MVADLGALIFYLISGVVMVDSLGMAFRRTGNKDVGFLQVFSALGITNDAKSLYCKYLGMTSNNNYILLAFSLSDNLTSEDFKKRQKDIAEKLGVDSLEISTRKNIMYFKIRKTSPPPIEYNCDKIYPDHMIPIGYDDDFKPILWDLHIDSHMLIGGATNSGKTVSMHGLIHYITISGNYDLYLSDMKRGVDFNVYGMNNLSSIVAYANTVTQTQKLISLFEAESNIRWNNMREVNAKNYEDWKTKDYNNVPKLAILMIDEYPDLVPIKLAKGETDYIAVLVDLARKCRAVGMHIVISAQYPEAKIMPTALRNNFTGRMAFRTADSISSRVILNKPGCEKLTVGECYARLKGREVRIRTALVKEKDIEQLVEKYSYPVLDSIIDTECRENNTGADTKYLTHNLDEQDVFAEDFFGGM